VHPWFKLPAPWGNFLHAQHRRTINITGAAPVASEMQTEAHRCVQCMLSVRPPHSCHFHRRQIIRWLVNHGEHVCKCQMLRCDPGLTPSFYGFLDWWMMDWWIDGLVD